MASREYIIALLAGVPAFLLGWLTYRRSLKVDAVAAQAGVATESRAGTAQIIEGLNGLIDQLQEDLASYREELKDRAAHFRDALQEQDARFREELKDRAAHFRDALQEQDARFRAELQERDARLAKIDAECVALRDKLAILRLQYRTPREG